jgi:hypothetical protein
VHVVKKAKSKRINDLYLFKDLKSPLPPFSRELTFHPLLKGKIETFPL